jgi:FtsZ-binding cell division protein ZapB
MSTASPTPKDVSDSLPNDPSQDDLVAAIEALANEAQRAREERDRLREENEQLREELAEERERSARERADVRSDVHELTEAVESDDGDGVQGGSGDETHTPQTGETTTQAPVTALGDCVTLPEPLAEQELTANVKRARDVAADVIDYARSVPAGYAITSTELRTVLTAMKDDDGRTFTETVGRVIGYLDELGDDDVTVKETMGGQRTVVFSDEFVRRTVAWRQSSNHAVVASTEASG